MPKVYKLVVSPQQPKRGLLPGVYYECLLPPRWTVDELEVQGLLTGQLR